MYYTLLKEIDVASSFAQCCVCLNLINVSVLRVLPLHDSHNILALKLSSWKKHVDEVREWYNSEHQNWKPLDGENSKWSVWNAALVEARASVQQIQNYLQHIERGEQNTNSTQSL